MLPRTLRITALAAFISTAGPAMPSVQAAVRFGQGDDVTVLTLAFAPAEATHA